MPDISGLLGQLLQGQGSQQPQAQQPFMGPSGRVSPDMAKGWSDTWGQYMRQAQDSTNGFNRMPFVMNGDMGQVSTDPGKAHDQMYPQNLQANGVRPVFAGGHNVGKDLADAGVPDSATGGLPTDMSWAKIIDGLGLDPATAEKLKGLVSQPGGALNQPNLGTAASPQYQSQVTFR